MKGSVLANLTRLRPLSHISVERRNGNEGLTLWFDRAGRGPLRLALRAGIGLDWAPHPPA